MFVSHTFSYHLLPLHTRGGSLLKIVLVLLSGASCSHLGRLGRIFSLAHLTFLLTEDHCPSLHIQLFGVLECLLFLKLLLFESKLLLLPLLDFWQIVEVLQREALHFLFVDLKETEKRIEPLTYVFFPVASRSINFKFEAVQLLGKLPPKWSGC